MKKKGLMDTGEHGKCSYPGHQAPQEGEEVNSIKVS